MEFGYIAFQQDGRAVKGELHALDRSQALDSLQRSGLFVARLRPVKNWSWLESVSPMEVVIFYRQVATVLRSGLPVLTAIQLQKQGSRNGRLHRIMADMELQIESGQDFWQALAAYPAIFKPLHVEIIRGGQSTGLTDQALDQVAEMYRSELTTLRQLRSAMIYPAFMLVFVCVAIAVVFLFVVPQLKTVFDSFGADLPLPTRMLIFLGDVVQQRGHWILAVTASAVLAISLWSRTLKGRLRLSALLLAIPLIGKTLRTAAVARFSRALAETISSGLAAENAIELAIRSTGRSYFKQKLYDVKPRILAGDGLVGPLMETGLFPSLFCQVLRVGETTGRLQDAMKELAEYYDDEVKTTAKNFTSALEPVMLLFMVAGVAFYAISVVVPLSRMNLLVK